MKKTYIILVVVAAVTLLVYSLLPKKIFEEVVFPMDDSISVLGYDDSTDGGESVAHLVSSDSAISFDCKLGTDTTKSAWCGLLWNMDPAGNKLYRNWTFVDSLIFDVDAEGTNEVLLKLWTYDPDVTDVTKARTFRLLMKEMPLRKGRQRVSIPMDHLYTPDFWYETSGANRELTSRHQETVARLEIAPGWNQARGKKFTVKFYSAKAIGVSNIAFGIVLFIFLILTIVAVGRRHQIKNDIEKN